MLRSSRSPQPKGRNQHVQTTGASPPVGVECPGGFVLGGDAHADGGVWPGGARTSGPARWWLARAASMSCQVPGQRMSSALYKEFSASARAKPKGVALRPHRGDCLAVGQGLPVADGPVLHPSVASGAPGPSDRSPDVSAARRPFSGRRRPGRCTLAGRWSASR